MNKLNEGVYFISNDHSRFENGVKVNADNKGALRGIKILRDESEDVYGVSMHILDESMSNWGDKIQMAPKQMKIISQSNDKILLRGFGYDNMGNSFSDYAMELNYQNDSLFKSTLILVDRNVKITYHKATKIISNSTSKIQITTEILNLLIENHDDDDSLIFESDVIENLEEKFSLQVNSSEIIDAVKFINSQCNQPIISERWITKGFMSVIPETALYTEARISFLEELSSLIK
jgi:hypothetical protein